MLNRHFRGRIAFGLVVLVGLVAGPARSLDPTRSLEQFSYSAWTTEDGLPQVSVLELVQSADGFLWLGTQEGLVRFDGIEFLVFDHDNTPALPHNAINDVLFASDGTTWIGTPGGLTRRLGTHDETIGIHNGLPHALVVSSVEEGRDGAIWVGTLGGGVARFHDGTWRTFDVDDGLPSNIIRKIVAFRDGRIGVGTDGGLVAYEDGGWSRIEGADSKIWTLHEHEDSSWMIGAVDGFGVLSPAGTLTWYTTDDGRIADEVRVIGSDRDGSVWIGTPTGVERWIDDRFESFPDGHPLAVSAHTVSFLEDHEGNLWLGQLQPWPQPTA